MRSSYHRPPAAVAGLLVLLLALAAACTRLIRHDTPAAPGASLTLGSGAPASNLALAEQQVTAEIREQMAQVHVALTFRAPTGRVPRDGVFRFPLPSGASVASFALATGDGERVFASIVERRRAGGILSARLQEGGSAAQLTPAADGLFEVRLVGLTPQWPPRIDLTYTQFLPLEGGTYACSLPRSPARVPETLRVTVHSSAPLSAVTCSLPAVQVRRGPRSALLDYHGMGGSEPLRVDLCPEPGPAPVLACGYERGGDGYFLLLAQAPGNPSADSATPSAAVTDLRLEASGLPVAAVYPHTLPELLPGGQLVVVGRYRPPLPGTAASLVLHGARSGQPVRLGAPLQRDDSEGGWSFIPRLWAQRHLEALLAQPQTEDRVAEIVELSEDCQVLTPYTTFLVAYPGPDATAEGHTPTPQRRLRPSDGAWFFAEGRERARLETLRQQQRVADEAWTEFRIEALRPLFQFRDEAARVTGALGGSQASGDLDAWAWNRLDKPPPGFPRLLSGEMPRTLHGELRLLAAVTAWQEMDRAVAQAVARPLPASEAPRPEALPGPPPARVDHLGGGNFVNWQEPPPPPAELLGLPRGEAWLLGSHRLTEPVARALGPPHAPDIRFPADVRAVSRELLCLPRLTGPVAVEAVCEQWDQQRGAKEREQRYRLLLAPGRWLLVQETRSTDASSNQPRSLQWCTPEERGVLIPSRGLGAVRPARPEDAVTCPMPFPVGLLQDLTATVSAGGSAILERLPDGRLRLAFAWGSVHSAYVVDGARHVVLEWETGQQGPRGPYPPVRYEGFVEAGGCWWPGRAVQRDATGALAQQVPFAVRDLGTADFEEQWTAALGVRRACLVLPCPLASRQELIAAWHSGSVTVPQRYALARHFVDTAQWSRAEEQLGALRGAGVPELAIDEMSTALLRGTQGTGPWLDACLARARRLAERPQPDELALAVAWFGYPRQPFGGEDRLRLLEALAPVFARQPEWLDAGRMVRQFRIEALFEAGRQAEAEALQRETLTAERPADFAGPFAHGMLDPNRTPLYRKDLLAQDAWVREHLLPASGASSETESMLVSYCEAQLNGGRPAAALSLLEAWRQQVAASVPPAQPGPTSSGGLEWQRAQGHWRYLQAMAREGREKDADQLAATWLRRTTSGGPLSAREQAEAGAALRYATTGPQEMFVSHHVEAPLADALLSASLAALQRPDLEWLATEVVYSSSGFHWGHRDAFEAAWLAHNAGGPARNPAAFPRPPATAFLERLGKQGLSETEEGEALARVGGLESAAGAECDPALRVNLLASVVDAMVQSRFARRLGRDCAAPGALAADPDAACLAALRQARSETRECLAIESRQAPEALRSWYELERQWLDLLTGTDPEGLAAECRRALGETVPTGAARVSWLDAIPTAQRLAVLKRLCLTEGAPPARAEALLAYLAAGTASPADARVWKLHRLSLLLALDQRRELEEVLTGWVRDEPADPTWRIALGYCLARQDRLAEAIAQFETAAEPFGLPQREARLLGAWRLLVDSDSSSPAALAPSARPDFTRLAIRDLLGLLKADDPNADLALTAAETREALLCLARREPRLVLDAVELLATAYSRNRDPRLLAVVPELLQEADLPAPFAFAARVHRLLSRLNDEAAVSALAASLHEARPRLTGDRARAADLVEVACLALLTAVGPAATGDLSQAEALLERAAGATQDGTGRGALIGLLLAWGQVAEGPLRQAQTHWLGVLLADPAASLTPRRRDLCLSYARLLWSYQRRDEAVAILERALALLPTQGTAPSFGSGDQVLETLTGYLREAGQMPRCETLLLSRLDQATEAAQRAGLEEALGTLWVQALGGKAVLAVGPGQGLYDDAHRQLRAWLDAAVGQHFAKLAEHLCALHQAAHQAGCTGVTERLDELCLAVPRLLADQIAGFQEQDVIKAVATARHDVLGARSALLMLTEQIENEPCRLRYDHRPGWAEHAETIVAWTAEVGADAELDRRLGNLALRELRGFLHSDHETWTPEIHYQRGSGAFRGDLVSSFADTAEAEAQANPDDGFVTTQAGFYLADELGLPERAAALLAAADARGRLDRTGRLERARCTLAAGHAVEAAALAGRLATDLAATQIGPRHDRRIQALDAQVVWLEALASAGDDRGFAAALAATEADLRRLDVRRLEAVTRLTQTCLEGRRFADSARLFGSALALHALTARFREKPAARFPLLEGLIASYRGRGQAKAAAEVCRNWLSRGDLDSTERNALASLLDGGGGSATGLPAAEATSPPGG